jgi:hypothetical protein
MPPEVDRCPAGVGWHAFDPYKVSDMPVNTHLT